MKIVHVCLHGIVTDGFTYQDNLLPKYHKKLGYDVAIITSKWSYNKEGKVIKLPLEDYINDDDIRVIRLNTKKENKFENKFKRFKNFYGTLETEAPDILFVHGVQFLDISVIVKYVKKHKNVKVYVDNHCDYSNSATNFLSKYVLHRIIWRHMAKKIEPYTTKFYGVLPVRVDFLIENYKLPREKCELLIMGADDERISEIAENSTRSSIRKNFGIKDEDFLIVTGGKIDLFKLQTLLLMEAVSKIANQKLKLIVFGSIEKSIIDKVKSFCDEERIQYIGWANEKQSYEYFYMADLVVFPGRHSVYWEQVVAMGKPMICKYWEGTTHINIGGNVMFLYEDSVDEVKNYLEKIINNKDIYENMVLNANKNDKNMFLYSNIAKKSIIDDEKRVS